MKELIGKRIANLLTVKSLVTIILTIIFSIMTFKGVIPQELNSIYLMVISFYFGTQSTKES